MPPPVGIPPTTNTATLIDGIAATTGGPKIAPIEKPTYATAGPIEERASAVLRQSVTIGSMVLECHPRGTPGRIVGSFRSPWSTASMHTTASPVCSAYRRERSTNRRPSLLWPPPCPRSSRASAPAVAYSLAGIPSTSSRSSRTGRRSGALIEVRRGGLPLASRLGGVGEEPHRVVVLGRQPAEAAGIGAEGPHGAADVLHQSVGPSRLTPHSCRFPYGEPAGRPDLLGRGPVPLRQEHGGPSGPCLSSVVGRQGVVVTTSTHVVVRCPLPLTVARRTMRVSQADPRLHVWQVR